MDSLKCNVLIVLSLVLTQVLDKKAINTCFLYMDHVCSSLLHAKTKKETRYSPCSLGLHSGWEGENNLPASSPPNCIIIHRASLSLDLRRDHINSLFLSNVSWTQYFLLFSSPPPPLQSRPIKPRLAIPNQWMTNSMGYLEELLCQP